MNAKIFRPEFVRWCLPVLAALALLALAWNMYGQFQNPEHIGALPFVGKALLVFGLLLLGFTATLFCLYRPARNCPNQDLPYCTVIVPAYNEGAMVLDTLRSVMLSDYPADKLQVIAVDDGSVDDTWAWMSKAAAENHRIEVLRLGRNMGKRHALYEGIRRSEGQVLVTIDSDSLIEAGTLRALVSPFVQDSRVGAVAGRVAVLNKAEGIIPSMLEVSFAFSFEFVRASQSVLNTVLCTPGALSAYRREVVMQVLDQWLTQTFMGKPARIGEDRAMTNAILRQGYHSRFQSTAVVHTNAPLQYRQLSKMFLRWARSNVRETLVMGSFVFRKFRQSSAIGARLLFCMSVLRLALAPVLLLTSLTYVLWQPTLYLPHLLFGVGLSSCLPALFYMWRRGSISGAWALPYALFWLCSLSWITPYAMLTAGNSSWLTREKPQLKPQLQPQSKPEFMHQADALVDPLGGSSLAGDAWTVRPSRARRTAI